MSRSTETIRLTLKAHDHDYPDRAIFPNTLPPLDDEAKGQIYRRFRTGRLGRGPGQTVRPDAFEHLPCSSMKCGPGAFSSTKLEFIEHSELRRARDGRRNPRTNARAGRRQGAATAQGTQGFASLPREPVRGPACWTASRRSHLFRKMNYLKYKTRLAPRQDQSSLAAPRRNDSSPASRRSAGDGVAVRKPDRTAQTCGWWSPSPSGTVGPAKDFFNLVSDGNVSLMRAVEPVSTTPWGTRYQHLRHLGDHQQFRPDDS